MPQPFDLILLAIDRDLSLLSRSQTYIRAFLAPERITFIAAKDCLERIREMGIARVGDLLLDEDQVVPGLELGFVRSLIAQRGGNPERAGWYFKQITNFAYARRPDASPFYLTWDADTIPLRPIRFFDECGRALLTTKGEYNKPYFEVIEALTGLQRQVDYSFIAEHMMFERDIVNDLIDTILGGLPFRGDELARRILGAVSDANLSSSGFAEYETYGTFALARHPDRIAVRELASLRHGTAFFGRSPSNIQLFAAGRLYTWVSFESWKLMSPLQRLKKIVARCVGALWALPFALARTKAFKRFEDVVRAAAI
jgi:hypothetical protein